MNSEGTVIPDDDKIFFDLYRPGDILENRIKEDLVHISEKIKERLKDIFQLYVEIGYDDEIDESTAKIVQDQLLEINKNNDFYLSFITTFKRDNRTRFAFMARPKPEHNSYIEIRIASAGNVDSGKSTLLGVLTNNILDDGRGLARSKMFNHQHEILSGRTSSVGEAILCVDYMGNLTPANRSSQHRTDFYQIPQNTSKIFNLIDLAGHEKYLKTTIYGLVGLRPDYILLVIGSNMGLVGMSKEHLGLALSLKIPIYFVLTKIDMCPENVRKDTLKGLIKLLHSIYPNRNHILVNSKEDVLIAFTNLSSNQLFVIFQVSCVTGDGLDYLRLFLSLLPSRLTYNRDLNPLFWIDRPYNGIGCVVSGTLIQGVLHKNDDLLLGPNHSGEFIAIQMKSIQRKRDLVDTVYAGQTCTLALKRIKREQIAKGMIITSPSLFPVGFWKFRASIRILHHPTTIGMNYQALVHAGPVRQTAQIVWMEKEPLRSGDKSMIIMRFISHPEFLIVGTWIVFREGRTKAIGLIEELLEPAKCDPCNGVDKPTSHPVKDRRKKPKEL